MTKPEGPEPTLPERLRMPLRIGSVFVAYVIYLLVEGPVVGRLLLAAGFIAFDWAVIEMVTTWRKDRLNMMVMGQGLLGSGLMIGGIVLLVAG